MMKVPIAPHEISAIMTKTPATVPLFFQKLEIIIINVCANVKRSYLEPGETSADTDSQVGASRSEEVGVSLGRTDGADGARSKIELMPSLLLVLVLGRVVIVVSITNVTVETITGVLQDE